MTSIQVCEIKSAGPYLTSVSYKIAKDCSVKIVRHKWLKGYFEDPDDLGSWKNLYDIIDLGEFFLKTGDDIDIQNKGANSSIIKPLKIGDSEKEGYGSDKYYITFPDESYFSVYYGYLVDH